MADVIKAAKTLQKVGLSVRTEKDITPCLRYKEKYVMKDGQPVKEEI